jgi:arsenate reductase (thioredoxin)
MAVWDGARESYPCFPNALRRLHWSLPDPSQASGSHEERLAVFRAVRDAMMERVRGFVSAQADPQTSIQELTESPNDHR